jgi:peptide/nickel transport system permease protein
MGGLTTRYVARRVGMLFLTVWLASTLIFAIPRMMPGDPVAAMLSRLTSQAGRVENAGAMIEAWQERFGLNEPILVQYWRFLKSSATFDFGFSQAYFPARVQDLAGAALPWTLGLLVLATLMSFTIGNLIGALLAWRRTPSLVKTLLPITLALTAIPFFMLGILFIYLFAFGLGWFPEQGAYSRGLVPGFNWAFISSLLHHGALPAFAMVVASMGFWALGMRGMMVMTEGENYMVLAEAKGLRPQRLFWKYGIRNAVLPQVTALSLTMGSFVGGQIVVEYIFGWPGIAYLLYQGIINSDFALIQGIVFILIFATAVSVLIIDLLYPLLDPRISYQRT